MQKTANSIQKHGAWHHAVACTPTKKPRKQSLLKEEKQHNRALARLRVRVEHVIRRFQELSDLFGTLTQSQKAVWLALEPDCWPTEYELAHTLIFAQEV